MLSNFLNLSIFRVLMPVLKQGVFFVPRQKHTTIEQRNCIELLRILLRRQPPFELRFQEALQPLPNNRRPSCAFP
jgi:hypothetical protein